MEVVKKLRCTLGFLTIIPVGGCYSLRETAAGAWLFPLVGAILGIIAGSLGHLFSLFLPWSIAVAIAFFSLLLLTGFHHLDGLLDLGDAVMVRGSQKQRQRVMHSPGIGAGAFGLGVMTVLVTYIALSQSRSIIAALVIAEASAKVSMLLVASIAGPAWKGMGEEFIQVLRGDRKALILGIILYLAILVPTAGLKLPVLFLMVIVFSFLMARFSKTLIGGTSGDVLGATNEITRMLALVVLL
jgi:adenosylcobinamide-GDP ribazoletransferase